MAQKFKEGDFVTWENFYQGTDSGRLADIAKDLYGAGPFVVRKAVSENDRVWRYELATLPSNGGRILYRFCKSKD